MAQIKGKDKTLVIDAFWGGMSIHDKPNTRGSVSNMEEVDIFSNKDWAQAAQIMSADTLPASTAVYAFTSDESDNVWAYGKETAANKVRLLKVATGGADNPGDFSTVFTSADATNLATIVSGFKFHKTSEAQTDYLYYIAGASATWYLKRYNITAGTEASVGQLTGLGGSFDRPWMKTVYGELYIGNGRYIAHVDDDGVFTEQKFTLPQDWVAVDFEPLSDTGLILCRNKNRLVNQSAIFQWDLVSSTQFDDSIIVPMGGAQWIKNHKEVIRFACAINGLMRIGQLNGSFPVWTHALSSVATETSTQAVSWARSVQLSDRLLYFTINKTDKTGIYALGQVEEGYPLALVLTKRFHTTDYASHIAYSLLTQGPNFYGAFSDNGTASLCRCESNNTPNRSSNAVIETTWIDFGSSLSEKDLIRAYLKSYPLGANTSLSLSVASDMSSSYTAVKRADDSVFNTANGLLGLFRPAAFSRKYDYRAKIQFTSSSSTSPKLQSVGLRVLTRELV